MEFALDEIHYDTEVRVSIVIRTLMYCESNDRSVVGPCLPWSIRPGEALIRRLLNRAWAERRKR